ncbi:hypothetical protein KOI40_05260 [Aestuariicella sp. G3-2]|jgi:hypothetical protein|uniref:hypothetical protein n=1 Tax=Pseudomaricurvus albidus TaxID=2842452 RepID=UPI001C0E17AC|nr:hypothetical protein [Aestuariicella albida]MBU3069219.1 hypothetical protein [Aestuariicella albida]
MRDSYERFFSQGYISKDQFFEFGLSETIYAPLDKAESAWKELKNRVHSNQQVFIRGFGRNSNGTHLFQAFYADVLKNNQVTVDPTNNAQPTKLIRDLTGYSKTKSSKHEPIQNYQISHIFGRTKNVFAFTAPWNIVYMPKMLDPFTGHEAKGSMIDEYQKLFREKSFKHFEPLINDYNALITSPSLVDSIHQYLDKIEQDKNLDGKDVSKLRASILEEITPIIL